MKKLLFILLCLFSVFIEQGNSQNYCLPQYTGTLPNATYIQQVVLGDLRDNHSIAHQAAQYIDYSSTTTTDSFYLYTTELIRGKNQSLRIVANKPGCAFTAWIDYNEDFSFDGQDEKIGVIYGPGASGTIQFHIPSWVNPGDKRLRVMVTDTTSGLGLRSDFLACEPIDPLIGQTLDYTVEIDSNYCFPILSQCDTTFMIDGIEFGNIVNLNTGKGTDCHSDYTNNPVFLGQFSSGFNLPITFHLKNLLSNFAYLNTWIDFDDDGENEHYERFNTIVIPVPAGPPVDKDTTTTITLPNATGFKRFRVQLSNAQVTTTYEDEACVSFARGEYEDYLIYLSDTLCYPSNSGSSVNGAFVNDLNVDGFTTPLSAGGTVVYKNYYDSVSAAIPLTADTTHNILVQWVKPIGTTAYVGIFADWNNDGEFNISNANENLLLGSSDRILYYTDNGAGAQQSRPFKFRTPTNLSAGPIHLRVVVSDSAKFDFLCPNPDSVHSGEIEDYKLIIANDDSLAPIPYVIPSPGLGSGKQGVHNFCPGYVQFYDASYHHPSKWHWYFPGGQPTEDTVPNPRIFYSNAGAHSVRLVVENSFGVSDTVTWTDLIYITANGINFRDSLGNSLSDAVVSCSGASSFQLNAQDGYFDSYSWNNGAGTSAQFSSTSASLPDTNRVVLLTHTTANGMECFIQDSILVTLNATPSISITADTNVAEICATNSFNTNITAHNTSSIFGTYSWSYLIDQTSAQAINDNDTLLNYNQDLSQQAGHSVSYVCTYNPGNPGSYGCALAYDTVTYQIKAQPVANIHIVDDGFNCVGANLTAFVDTSGGVGPWHYQWNTNSGTINGSSTLETLRVDNAQNTSTILTCVYHTEGLGCDTPTVNKTAGLFNQPVLGIVSTSKVSMCNGDTLRFMTSVTQGNNAGTGHFHWEWRLNQNSSWNPIGDTISNFQRNLNIGTIPGDTTVIIRAQYRDSIDNWGCISGFDSTNLRIRIAPQEIVTVNQSSVCSGDNITASLVDIAGYSHHWNIVTLSDSLIVGPQEDTITINNFNFTILNQSLINTGFANLLVQPITSDPNSCNGIQDTIPLVIHRVPASPLIPHSDTTVCSFAQNLIFPIAAQAGMQYIWTTLGSTLLNMNNPDTSTVGGFSVNAVTSVQTDSVSVYGVYTNDPVCRGASAFVQFTITPDIAPNTSGNIVKYLELDNTLVCLRNDVDGFQWGCDRKSDLKDSIIPDQIFQSCSFGNSFDVTNFYYWVILYQGNCKSKYYFGGVNGNDFPDYVRGGLPQETTDGSPSLLVFPNPSQGNFVISLQNFLGTKATMEIYDALGKQVGNKEVELGSDPEVRFESNFNLDKGIYWLRVVSTQGETALISFVIQ